MSAPAGWQPGSFRGVPFRTEEQEVTGGRRGVSHEFPQGEKPVWEDLGRSARRYRIDCHITGADYPAGADALQDALDAPGAGTLVHPWFGSMQVAVPTDGWSRSDSTIDGGIARFAIEFVETGLAVPPPAASDTQALSHATADDVAAGAAQQAGRTIKVGSAIAFIEKAAADVTRYAAIAMEARAALSGGIGPTLSFLTGQIGLLGDAGALLRAPLQLGLTVVQTIQTLALIARPVLADGTPMGSGMTSAQALPSAQACRALMDFGGDLDPVTGTTPARVIQAENQAAIVQLVNLAAAAELVRCHAATDFASYDEAVAARDDAASRLDALALRQADRGDDDGAALYDQLRRAVTADLTARGGTLARLQSYTPAATMPALVIAQRLYGDPGQVAAQSDAIVARNRVRHPGFVPGGAPLQVLSMEAARG